jgi:alpha-L-fucosidase
MIRLRSFVSAGLFAYFSVAAAAGAEVWDSDKPTVVPGRRPDLDANTLRALERFNADRFAMFIHWGLYSQAGGEIGGKRFFAPAEWIMNYSRTRSADYLALAPQFNPVDFDAERWVRAIKASGVRYVVITAKHHEGFAMFATKASPHNIVDATPFKRDPLREFTDAAARHGIGVGFYYSQYQDWIEADAGGNTWEFDPAKADFNAYYQRKVLPQLTELLTNYGKVRELWFDTPKGLTREQSHDLRALVKRLQPECLVNSRIGHNAHDYASPGDNEIPAHTAAGGDWEAVFTLNHSWGFSKHDNDYRSTEEVLRLLAITASRGGNFMININPDERGRFPEAATQRLVNAGKWLERNGESIYGTRASTLPQVPWGVATTRREHLYLHVLEQPRDGRLIVPGLSAKDVVTAVMLGSSAPVAFDDASSDLAVRLPALPSSELGHSVVKLTLRQPPRTNRDGAILISRAHGRQALDVGDAKLEGAGVKKRRVFHTLIHSRLFVDDERVFHTADGLSDPGKRISWPIRFLAPGEYRVTIEYSANPEQGGRDGVVTIGEKELLFRVRQGSAIRSESPVHLIREPIGTITVSAASEHTVSVRPVAAGGDLFSLRTVYLSPVD